LYGLQLTHAVGKCILQGDAVTCSSKMTLGRTCYDCVQHVVKRSSSVTQDCAFRQCGSVTVTMTVETSPMNKTAVSA